MDRLRVCTLSTGISTAEANSESIGSRPSFKYSLARLLRTLKIWVCKI